MNNVVLMGRLTKDVEVRTTSSGLKVAEFTLAIDRVGKSDETDFVRCTAWRQSAEYLEKYAQKGNRVLAQGRIQVDSWEDDEENYHEVTRVNCNTVTVLDYNNAEKQTKSKFKKSSK